MSARQNILERIQIALKTPTALPVAKPDFSKSPYTPSTEEGLDLIFAENFCKGKAEFYFATSIEESFLQIKKWCDLFIENKRQDIIAQGLQQEFYPTQIFVWEDYLQELCTAVEIAFETTDKDLQNIDIGITFCEFLVGRTGSIIVTSRQKTGRRLTIYPPVHIVVAFTSQIVMEVEDVMKTLKSEPDFPSMISVVSGPSQTADIEKTLVLGAHGPKELILFLIDNTSTNAQD
jgi:L-lactate dehydrogenase complex protein LldG